MQHINHVIKTMNRSNISKGWMEKKRKKSSRVGIALSTPAHYELYPPKLLHFKLVSLQCAIAYFVCS